MGTELNWFFRPKTASQFPFQKPYGMIIPLYIYPADVFTNSDYNKIIQLARQHPQLDIVAILNPSNGAGASIDLNYLAAVKRLKGAGVKVAGYVFTSYSSRNIADVKADIYQWKKLYPVDGIFFDEITNDDVSDHINYYAELTRFSKSLGFDFTIGNPGSVVPKSYFDNHVADIIVTWENSYNAGEDYYAQDFDGGLIEVPRDFRAFLLYNQNSTASETIGTGDGTATTFSATLSNTPAVQSSVSVSYTIGGTTYTATDDGQGNISGTECTGTIDYTTGVVNLTFTTAPDDTTTIDASYAYADFSIVQPVLPVAGKYHKFLFVTHDGFNGTNPWDHLSFYLDSLFGYLASL